LELNESQELARAIVHVFSAENRAISFFHECFAREVKRTLSQNVLFRSDCASTKSATAYLKLIDSHCGYLHYTLHSLIVQVKKDPEIYDPIDVKSEHEKKHREQNLADITQKFFDAILVSHPKMPLQFCELLHHLRSIVALSFPESELKAVNGIIFLRFICPSIFSPKASGILDIEPDTELQRTLTLIAKNLQTLANSVQTAQKELDQYGNKQKMTEFLNSISTKPKAAVPSTISFAGTDEDKVKSMEMIVKYLREHFERLVELSETDPRLSKDPALAAELKLQLEDLRPLIGK